MMKTGSGTVAWMMGMLLLLPGCALFKSVGVVDHWAAAEAAYNRKKYDEAASHYAAIKPTDPKYQRAQVGIGRCLWKQDKVKEAAQQMLDARRIDTKTFDAKKRLVRDLSLVYGAAAARPVAQVSDPIISVWPQDGGGLLLLSDRGTLSAVTDKGATQWELQLGSRHDGGRAHVAFDAGVAFAVAYDSKASRLLAIDPKTGDTRWSHDLGGGYVHATADAGSGSVYAPTHDAVVALDSASGEVRWRAETAKRSGQVLRAGDTVCAEGAKDVACWSASSGEALGSYGLPKRSDKGGLVSDGKMLWLTTDDAVYAVDIAGGMKLAWKQVVGTRASAPVLDDAAGVVAVTTVKQLLTFDAKSGKPRLEADKPPVGIGTRLAPTAVGAGWLISSGQFVYSVGDSGGWDWIAGFESKVTSRAIAVSSNSVVVAISGRPSPEVMDVLAKPW